MSYHVTFGRSVYECIQGGLFSGFGCSITHFLGMSFVDPYNLMQIAVILYSGIDTQDSNRSLYFSIVTDITRGRQYYFSESDAF